MEMSAKYLINTDIKPYAFYKFLELVLLNNYFVHKIDSKNFTFYLQLKGIAMGTSCGPAIANIYLSYFELKYKVYINNSLYYRFIDDISYTDSNNTLTNMLPEIFPDLKLNIVSAETVQFLDLNMNFNRDRSIDYDLFTKPTFTGSYLNTTSNHPNFIYRGITISLVSRIRRICTLMNRYYYNTSILYSYLLKKGYSPKLVLNIIRSYANTDRNTLIDYKLKNTDKLFEKNLFFITPFNQNFTIDYKFLNKIWHKSLPDNTNLSNFNLKIVYKTTPNLNSYFVSRLGIPFKEASYSRCDSLSCKICKYSINENFMFNFKFIDIYIPHFTKCCSSNIIYAIHCIKCKKSYIGESSRTALIRLNEHIKKITYYKTHTETKESKDYKDSQILYDHFKHSDHSLNNDFRFQIICENIKNFRNRLETDLIYIFNTEHPNGLNTQTKFKKDYFQTYSFNN
jgi:hypothetical protein